MKGVIFSKIGAAPEIVDNLTKPEPKEGHVLVKSIWTAINPVDTFMSSSGILVSEWPLVLGVDAGGIIEAVHQTVTDKYPHLKKGTPVFGCTRLGQTHYSTVQEYYLMDAALLVPKPANISIEQSSTLGVASYTASLGLFAGLDIALPEKGKLPAPGSKDEWIVIQGGAGSVGKAAVQIAHACGYKVITSCSSRSAAVCKALGTNVETFDYKTSLTEQVDRVLSVTDGKVSRVFDTAAGNTPDLAQALFKSLNERGSHQSKFFSTTNDWSGIQAFEGCKVDLVSLGPIGKDDAKTLNSQVASYIPFIHELVEQEKLTPAETFANGDGKDVWADATKAFRAQQSGEGGNKKVVVKLGDEN